MVRAFCAAVSRVGHVPVLDKLWHLLGLVSHLKIRHAWHVRNPERLANVLKGLAVVMKKITDLGKPVSAGLGRGGVRQVQRTYTQNEDKEKPTLIKVEEVISQIDGTYQE